MEIVYLDEPPSLAHSGIPGMKWYHRRFQNEDGSLTAAGRERYNKRYWSIETRYNKIDKNIIDPNTGRWMRLNDKAERLSYEKGFDDDEFKEANRKAARAFQELATMVNFASTMKRMEMQNLKDGTYSRGKVFVDGILKGGLLSRSAIDYMTGKTPFPVNFGTSLTKDQMEELKMRYADFKSAWSSKDNVNNKKTGSDFDGNSISIASQPGSQKSKRISIDTVKTEEYQSKVRSLKAKNDKKLGQLGDEVDRLEREYMDIAEDDSVSHYSPEWKTAREEAENRLEEAQQKLRRYVINSR